MYTTTIADDETELNQKFNETVEVSVSILEVRGKVCVGLDGITGLTLSEEVEDEAREQIHSQVDLRQRGPVGTLIVDNETDEWEFVKEVSDRCE